MLLHTFSICIVCSIFSWSLLFCSWRNLLPMMSSRASISLVLKNPECCSFLAMIWIGIGEFLPSGHFLYLGMIYLSVLQKRELILIKIMNFYMDCYWEWTSLRSFHSIRKKNRNWILETNLRCLKIMLDWLCVLLENISSYSYIFIHK